jgi:PHD/YefM family antitoxin component YafN of YafNO toxin-antitoxin module
MSVSDQSLVLNNTKGVKHDGLKKNKNKRSATLMSEDEFNMIKQSIQEVRIMVRSTTDLLEKFSEAISKPLVPTPKKKVKLSSYV